MAEQSPSSTMTMITLIIIQIIMLLARWTATIIRLGLSFTIRTSPEPRRPSVRMDRVTVRKTISPVHISMFRAVPRLWRC